MSRRILMLYDVLMNINPVAFRIGNLEVRWYGLIITCAMVLGLIILIFMAKKKGISSDDTLELFLWVIPLGIVFARIIYVFANNKEYGYFPIESWDDFVNCIAIWDGGITIYGGMVGGVLGALIFCKRKKSNSARYSICLCRLCCCVRQSEDGAISAIRKPTDNLSPTRNFSGCRFRFISTRRTP